MSNRPLSGLVGRIKGARRAALRVPLRERGQNLVEFALALPALLMIVIGGYNIGLLFLRFSDTNYIAQSAAISAARYGGYTPEVLQDVNTQVQNSFLASDSANFSWTLQTYSGNGDLVCGSPGPVPTGPQGGGPSLPGPRGCTCNWGDQVVVVASYRWRLQVLWWTWNPSTPFTTSKSELCWRGTAGGG